MKREIKMKRDTDEERRGKERRERETLLECPPASEILVPNVRCCLAVPELIETNFRDVRSHSFRIEKMSLGPRPN